MPPARVPPAPQLPHEALSEIFVYPDPARALNPKNPFSDARRLEFFGTKIAEMAYMDVMRERWPHASASQMQTMITTGFRTFMERAVAAYQWLPQVHGPFPPNVNPHSPEEAHRVFLTYVGGVHVQYNSYPRIKEWFSDLKSAGV